MTSVDVENRPLDPLENCSVAGAGDSCLIRISTTGCVPLQPCVANSSSAIASTPPGDRLEGRTHHQRHSGHVHEAVLRLYDGTGCACKSTCPCRRCPWTRRRARPDASPLVTRAIDRRQHAGRAEPSAMRYSAGNHCVVRNFWCWSGSVPSAVRPPSSSPQLRFSVAIWVCVLFGLRRLPSAIVPSIAPLILNSHVPSRR
jgi:hypothetical protein